MTNLLYKDEVYAIIGASMDVYNELGPGFLEAVYQEAMEIELTRRGILFVSQPELPIFYKGERLKKYYIADFLIYDKIMIEIKALNSLTSHEEAQLLNELKITRTQLGLLINFGSDQKLEWKRRIYTKN
jgi:GxxExxY protein